MREGIIITKIEKMRKTTILTALIMLMAVFTAKSQIATAPTNGDGTIGNPYQIATLDNLYWLTQNSGEWDKYYIQTADIDASETSNWDISGSDTLGFSPIGNNSFRFAGNYNGQGHIINGIYIDRPILQWCGFFGYSTSTSNFSNLGLTNVNITGGSGVGGMSGTSSNSFNNCFVTGVVSGDANVGGFVGYQNIGSIKNCYSRVNVIRNSGSASTFGGFAGFSRQTSVIENCYSTGSVVYLGEANPTDKGFVGEVNNTPIYRNNFFDSETSLQTTDANGTATAKTTAEMQQMCVYADSTWDFMLETVNGTDDIWGLNSSENDGYPFLAWQGFTQTESCCGYVDVESPHFTTQNTIIYLDETGNATLIVDSVMANATDNCAISDTTLSQTIFDCSDILTPVNIDVTLTDTTGNFITEQVTITVVDTINPTITCLANQVVRLTSGQTEYTVSGTEFDPTATDDNCGVASTENDYNSTATLDAATLPIGTTTITWTIVDDSGNEETCIFDVQVDANVGINTISENAFEIYPNPAKDFIIIASKEKQSIKSIEVIDITGKVVLNVIASKAKQFATINVSALKEGIYFINLVSDKGIIMKKIVIE
jgi:hypothetical protein